MADALLLGFFGANGAGGAALIGGLFFLLLMFIAATLVVVSAFVALLALRQSRSGKDDHPRGGAGSPKPEEPW